MAMLVINVITRWYSQKKTHPDWEIILIILLCSNDRTVFPLLSAMDAFAPAFLTSDAGAAAGTSLGGHKDLAAWRKCSRRNLSQMCRSLLMPKVVQQESVSSLYVNLYQVHGQAFVAKLHSKKNVFRCFSGM
jgi:hypothetical protein